jgi:Inner membrane component of T3SS, cytoplasmic domain
MTRPILRIRSPVIGRGEQIFELGEAPITIGRADDCDIVLLEQAASRLHARLMPSPEGWTLVDEDSDAGVFVGAERVSRRLLRDGDVFRVGNTDLQLVERPGSQPTVIGATRPPAASAHDERIAHAPTGLANPAHRELVPAPPTPHVPGPAAVHVPAPAAPLARAVPRVPPPPVSAPSFIDFGEVGRPVVEPSAPSFVDFGPVGRPQQPNGSAPSFFDMGAVAHPPRSSHSESFSGQLADEPSRIEKVEPRSSSLSTWVLLVGLFAALITAVVMLAYDVTWADFVGIFG